MSPIIIRIFIALFLISLAYGAWVAVYMTRLIKKGTVLAANSIPFRRELPGANERVLFVGDSSAVGVGSAKREETTAGFYAKDHPNAEIINLGVSGLRADGLIPILERAEKELGHFDLAVIQIGGNDITHATDNAELEASLRKNIEIAKRIADRVILLHSGNIGSAPIFPFPVDKYMTYHTREVRAVEMRLAAEYDITYVDLFREVADDIYPKDPAKYYAADLFHHSGAGYSIWYEAIKKAIEGK